MTGLHLSQYRIDAELGRGGMGIVYRATDTKLNRTVALKVLPAAALSSEDDRARFVREAQSAAQLHHPNIATVFGIDEAVPTEEGKEPQPGTETRLFIAMEYIEGETVREVVEKGPLKLQDAVNIAGQVAEALKEAHAKEIVHRDIKSANVMLTQAGVSKVLDFGLAKTNQSTMLTRMGSTLGTVAYMSPEQARGHEVDGRTDLYSLGTMLYEMVAGKLPFAGDYEQAVLYGIMNEPAEPLTAMRTGVPMELERIVAKLLSKEAEYRYQTAGDLLADLKSLSLGGSGVSRRSMPATSTAEMPVTTAQKLPGWVYGAMVGIAALALSIGWFVRPVPGPVAETVRRFVIPTPGFSSALAPMSSPDGRYFAMWARDSMGVQRTMLWNVRDGRFEPLPGGEGHYPLGFSPSGQWLLTENLENVYRTRVPTGRPIVIGSYDEAMWMSDEELLVATAPMQFARLSVESRELTPIEMTFSDSTYDSVVPLAVISGTSRILARGQAGNDAVVDALTLDLDTGNVHRLVEGANAITLFRDWLLYATGETGDKQIVAQRVSPDGGRMAGLPLDLASGISLQRLVMAGGDDVYLRVLGGGAGNFSGGAFYFSWIDADAGTTTGTGLASAEYDRFAFSPDGREVVVERQLNGAGTNLYVTNLETGTERRLTYATDVNRAPVWTASGRIYYAAGPPMSSDIYVRNADGSGSEELVVEDADFPDVSPDEKWLAFTREGNGGDLYALDLESGDLVAIDSTELRTTDAAISPDGRFVAYSVQPQQSGNSVSSDQRVVVRSFPDPTSQFVRVAEQFADDPKWSLDGEYLYFRARGVLSRMQIDITSTFRPVTAPEEFIRFPGGRVRMAFSPVDGRLLVNHVGETSTSSSASLEVILSFERYLDELASR